MTLHIAAVAELAAAGRRAVTGDVAKAPAVVALGLLLALLGEVAVAAAGVALKSGCSGRVRGRRGSLDYAQKAMSALQVGARCPEAHARTFWFENDRELLGASKPPDAFCGQFREMWPTRPHL